jgi:hypothetical protein
MLASSAGTARRRHKWGADGGADRSLVDEGGARAALERARDARDAGLIALLSQPRRSRAGARVMGAKARPRARARDVEGEQGEGATSDERASKRE